MAQEKLKLDLRNHKTLEFFILRVGIREKPLRVKLVANCLYHCRNNPFV